jgi:DNA topoisomerase-1
MRTDGVQIADEAVVATRRLIESDYGARYLPHAPRRYETKAKNAQEAHEAIRPTDLSRRPRDVKRRLDDDQAKLYELIWLRTMASQMESAELERTTVDINAKVADRLLDLRATGTVIKFDGFLTLYQEGRDEDPEDEESRRLPEMSAGEQLTKRSIAADQHFTEPPPRYSEASLVKRLEELGIGRPSTYASILQVLKDRKYVRLDKRRLYPEDRGRIVVAFLESFFAKYVEYDFTAGLEEQLDLISNNEIAWRDVLRDFWRDFIGSVDDIKDLKISQVIDALDALLAPHLFPPRADGGDPRQCPNCSGGRLTLKLSKFGAFIGCSNYPECRYTRPLSAGEGGTEIGTKVLGVDPESSLEVTLRSGRFGPYVQLGEGVDGEKPKRAGLPKGTSPDDVDLQKALQLLSLPREVGRHPEDGEPIRAGIGRFGPYVQHNKTYANLESADDVFSIGLNRAVTLIAEKVARGPRRRFGADPGRPLGDHPTKGGPIAAKNGRYGPYVSHAGVNATLPRDKTPETITLEEAVALLDARAERGAAPNARRRKAARPSAGSSRPSTRPTTKAPTNASKKSAASAGKKSTRRTTQAAE